MENPGFAKQNDSDSVSRLLPDIPNKLLTEPINIPPRQAAAYGTVGAQLKGELELPLQAGIELPPRTDGRIRSAGLMDMDNGMDRSCEATIYPVLDKPHTTGAFQDRRKIKALLRPA